MQYAGTNDSISSFSYATEDFTLQPGHIIYVKVASMNESINKLFNIELSTSSVSTYNETNLYLNGYTVNDSGYLNLPVIGAINVEGLTMSETDNIIRTKLMTMLKDVNINVRFAGFRYSVFGDVSNPGIFYNYSAGLNIFEALSKAGDITAYGNRKNVLVVRHRNGKNETFRLNLLSSNILADKKYIIHPNDMIYVEPVKAKTWKMNAPNISIVLSSISTLILVLNFASR
jgi:polysaccharide export outer membrane protein